MSNLLSVTRCFSFFLSCTSYKPKASNVLLLVMYKKTSIHPSPLSHSSSSSYFRSLSSQNESLLCCCSHTYIPHPPPRPSVPPSLPSFPTHHTNLIYTYTLRATYKGRNPFTITASRLKPSLATASHSRTSLPENTNSINKTFNPKARKRFWTTTHRTK